MKIGLLSDTHNRFQAPIRRVDDFFVTQSNKWEQALNIFRSNSCSIILQAGDMFDSENVSLLVIAHYIEKFKRFGIPIYSIFGQHDLYMYSLRLIERTPLAVLRASGVANLLGEKASCVYTPRRGDKLPPIHIYGANFGQEIPVPEDKKALNILVVHKMIGNKPLYPGQEITEPKTFLRRNPEYKLVLCGDYHYPFYEDYKGRSIINTGCLVRKTCSEQDLFHQPTVAVYDTETDIFDLFNIDIEPPEKVFNLSNMVNENSKGENSESLSELLNSLEQGGGSSEIRFKDALLAVYNKRKTPKRIRDIISEELSDLL